MLAGGGGGGGGDNCMWLLGFGNGQDNIDPTGKGGGGGGCHSPHDWLRTMSKKA